MTEHEKREKVIKGLECCAECGKCKSECPYDGKNNSMYGCTTRLAKDALELLKTQEPRVMTSTDFENNPNADEEGYIPVWVEYNRKNGWEEWWDDQPDEWAVLKTATVTNSGSRRYWTGKPTKQQMEATPWK